MTSQRNFHPEKNKSSSEQDWLSRLVVVVIVDLCHFQSGEPSPGAVCLSQPLLGSTLIKSLTGFSLFIGLGVEQLFPLLSSLSLFS